VLIITSRSGGGLNRTILIIFAAGGDSANFVDVGKALPLMDVSKEEILKPGNSLNFGNIATAFRSRCHV
jgi:hypothetical protein